jgi:hypothetical protein
MSLAVHVLATISQAISSAARAWNERADGRRTNPLRGRARLLKATISTMLVRGLWGTSTAEIGIMEARDAINGDVQLARRFDAVTLPRWTAGKEFEQLVC